MTVRCCVQLFFFIFRYWCNLSQIDAERPCLLILSSDWLLHQRDSICCEAWIQMQEDLIVWFTLHWHTCVFVICVFLAVPNQGTQRLHDHFYFTLNVCTRVFTTRFIHLVWHSLQYRSILRNTRKLFLKCCCNMWCLWSRCLPSSLPSFSSSFMRTNNSIITVTRCNEQHSQNHFQVLSKNQI